MEAIVRDYAPKGVRFIYFYKSLAHPEWNNYVTPYTLEERLMHVREAERKLGSEVRWLCDTMDNAGKHALGSAPNAEFIVGPDGKVIARHTWSDPDRLRRHLVEIVGPVENPTGADDLDLPPIEPAPQVAKGIVPRLELPDGMRPLRIEPAVGESRVPFYVKLRAEADAGYFDSGTGKLYLGFRLDPLYKVHWNNEARPLQFKLESPAGVSVTPASGRAPDVKEKADADPREFLLDLTTAPKDGDAAPLELSVRYFACDDANTFCIPVSQKYRIHLARDPDGGSVLRDRDPSESERSPAPTAASSR